jgi:hypothetical protein
MDFWKEFLLSAVKGLTSLIYNRAKSARRVLCTLLTLFFFTRLGLRIYQWGYKNGETHISSEFTKHLSRSGLPKGSKKYLNTYMTATFRDSTAQIDNVIERYIRFIDISGIILVVLITFCTDADNSGQSDP